MHDSHLVLGTAQLGQHYGIANKAGYPDQASATAMIQAAWENGVREFDTAQTYGKSEIILGECLAQLGLSNKAKIISKLHPDLDHTDTSSISKALDESLQKLKVPSLFAMLLHREEYLSLWDTGLSKTLNAFVSSGKVMHIGVSVYSPEKAIEALDIHGIDLIQLPANILDRRFEKAGVFALAQEKGKTNYVRSVFLQGLLLMNPEEIPEKMSFAKPTVRRLVDFAKKVGLAPDQLALGYLKNKAPEAHIVFGAETTTQVNRTVECWKQEIPFEIVPKVEQEFSDCDELIFRPELWIQ